MFMHTRYSLSVALPMIFFNRGEPTTIFKFSLYWLFRSSENFRSDCTSPKRALIAPLVLILVCGFVLSNYQLTLPRILTP